MRPTRKALQKLTLGLRREDPNRIWERRAPLTPDAINQLLEEEDVEVVVEPCERRVFTNTEYEKAGAKLSPLLDHAHILVGIKETPMDALARQRAPVRLSTANGDIPRTHVMFSHTAKGQTYNTGLLSQFAAPTDRVLGESAAQFEKKMELWPRLIDYELLTNDEGKRTVGFGWFEWLAFSSPCRLWPMRISSSGLHLPSFTPHGHTHFLLLNAYEQPSAKLVHGSLRRELQELLVLLLFASLGLGM